MSDEDEEKELFPFDHDEAEEVLNWAVSAGAMLHLLNVAPTNVPDDEHIAYLRESILQILQNMPGPLVQPVLDWAEICYDNAVEQEEIVSEFVEQLEQVDKEGIPDE